MATKKATPAQIAARKLFAQRAKAGTLKKLGDGYESRADRVKREKNPIKQKRVKKIPVGESTEIETFFIIEKSKDKKHWEAWEASRSFSHAKDIAELCSKINPGDYIRIRDVAVSQ